MIMPMIKYDAAEGRLRVTVDPAIPQLIPLLASNPLDQFDPADPWFSSLDPRAEGLAFSRRYGFVMDTTSDPLPSETAIWIRKLSGSPQLEIYRYRSSVPTVWEPIFGTAGSSNALQWDGMMFHPCVAATAGTNVHAAAFEAILADSLSGIEIPGTGTGPFELNWTTVPDGRPSLQIGYKVAISCRVDSGWVLEASDALPAATWVTVTNSPVMIDGQSTVVLESSQGRKFYRMRRLP
jgi:hypothetical protein